MQMNDAIVGNVWVNVAQCLAIGTVSLKW